MSEILDIYKCFKSMVMAGGVISRLLLSNFVYSYT